MTASIWNPTTPVLSAPALADFASTASSKGSGLIGFRPAGTGISTSRTVEDKLREEISLTDFDGADPTGATDSAAAIAAWLTHCYTNNADGFAPPGTYLTSTGHTVTYSASRKFQIRGAGRGATAFRKTGANSGAVFKFTVTSGDFIEMNLHLQDFEVDAPGLSAVNGIEFDAAALVTIERVRATACFVGLDAKGLLVSAIRDCDFSGNAVGVRFRRALAGSQPWANAVLMQNVRTNGNTSWGIDYGEGSGLYIRDCDVESNGTVSDVSTGGVIIRDTVDDETGFGLVTVDGLWLESNKGHSFLMQSASNAVLQMKNTQVYAQESTRAITVGAIRSATFENVLANSGAAELSCSAELQNYLGNVWAFSVSTSGASQVTGAFKTSSVGGDVWLATKARVSDLEVSTSLLGTVDGAVSVGSGSRRMNTIFATTGAINTSDQREKTAVRSITEAERAVALAIKASIGAFRFLSAVAAKGEDARWHFGASAQAVAAAFAAEGLDPTKYGMFCHDVWPEKPVVLDDAGNVIKPAEPAGDRYGLRYDELAMFVLAAL